MSILRAGVIGLGMGRHHITGYQSHLETKMVTIADLDQERLKEFGDKHDIEKRYTSAEDMLQAEDLDMVSVATPNHLHKPLTLAALDAGCHVLCEKPMFHFVDSIVNDCQQMAPGEEGLVVVKILDANYQSASADGPVRINDAG